MKRCTCNSRTDAGRRAFFTRTAAAAAAIGVAGAGFSVTPAKAVPAKGQIKFMQEATKLAIESVEKGWAGRSTPSSSRTARSSAAGRTACC